MTLEDYEKLDEELDMIPLRFPFAFLSMHNHKDLVKKLLISIFNLDSRYYDVCVYFGKDVLLSCYPSQVVKTSLLITFNGENWDLSKLSSLISLKNTVICNFVKVDDKLKDSNTIYELVLNTCKKNLCDKDLLLKDYKCGCVNISIENIWRCKKRFLSGEPLDKRELILLIFCANTFKELYMILCEIFDEKETYDFMRFMTEMSRSREVRKKYRKYKK